MTSLARICIAFSPGVTLVGGATGAELHSLINNASISLAHGPSFIMLRALQDGAHTIGAIEALIAEESGAVGVAQCILALGLLARHGLVDLRYEYDGKLHAIVRMPPEQFPEWVGTEALPDEMPTNYALHRFAFVRRVDEDLIIESTECATRVILVSDEAVASLSTGSMPLTLRETPRVAFTWLLWRLGLIQAQCKQEPPHVASWEFHDRLFHVRSRSSGIGVKLGATYRFRHIFPSPPAIKNMLCIERIDFGSDPTSQSGESMASVSERRQSIREGDDAHPIRLEDLGQILARTARIRGVVSSSDQELVDRPTPGAGALGELEIYLAIRACDGLQAGFYAYNAVDHCLHVVQNVDREALTQVFLDAAFAMASGEFTPQCVLIVASRIPRIAWKYEGIAYRLSLLNAGALIQSVYLAATDLGLACCALGTGNIERFSKLSGYDTFCETSIVEISLNSIDFSRSDRVHSN